MSFRRRSRHVGDNVVIVGVGNSLKSNIVNDLALEMLRNVLYEMRYINKQTWLAWSERQKTLMQKWITEQTNLSTTKHCTQRKGVSSAGSSNFVAFVRFVGVKFSAIRLRKYWDTQILLRENWKLLKESYAISKSFSPFFDRWLLQSCFPENLACKITNSTNRCSCLCKLTF